MYMSIDKKRWVEASDEVLEEEQPDEQEVKKVKRTVHVLMSMAKWTKIQLMKWHFWWYYPVVSFVGWKYSLLGEMYEVDEKTWPLRYEDTIQGKSIFSLGKWKEKKYILMTKWSAKRDYQIVKD